MQITAHRHSVRPESEADVEKRDDEEDGRREVPQDDHVAHIAQFMTVESDPRFEVA